MIHMIGLCSLYSKSMAFSHSFYSFLFHYSYILCFYSSSQISLLYFQSNHSSLRILKCSLCFCLFLWLFSSVQKIWFHIFMCCTVLLKNNLYTIQYTDRKYVIQWFFGYSKTLQPSKQSKFRTFLSFQKEIYTH